MSASGTVTLLFTDLVGSTELFERLGEDAAEELRRDHFRLLREAASAHGGEEVKNLGDGLMVAFPSTFDALGCATEIQQALDRRQSEPGWAPLSVRVGVNVGEVVREENDYFGRAVVVAKRLCDRAEGGQVLVSDLARGLVGSRGGYTFRHLGVLSLKGLADPLPTYELLWQREGASDPSSVIEPSEDTGERMPLPQSLVDEHWRLQHLSDGERLPLPQLVAGSEGGAFVGRAPELGRLLALLRRSRSHGHQLAFLVGEPGIGKTRLAAELARGAVDEGALVLYGHCYEENLLPFQPFVEALSHYVAHTSSSELRGRLETDLAPELGRLLPELKRRFPQIPEPIHAEPETARFRMFEAVSDLISRIAATTPMLLVLDDLQWADKPTLLLLKHMLRSPARMPILVVASYRESEVSHGHPLSQAMADLRREHDFERIALGGLTEEDVRALIHEWAGSEPSNAFARSLWQETEGNPFFLQEVLRHLLESGAISQREGRLTTARPVERLGIPESVREVIGRRLSRLSEGTEGVLEIAAVIGRQFGIRILERVTEHPSNELLETLEEAAAARVIIEVPGAPGRYRFAHTLVREVLYDGIGGPRRVRLHLRIGEALEELYAQGIESHLAEIAHHFLEGAVARDVDKALDYARRAGERASEQLAYEEAADHYRHALETLDLKDAPDAAERGELLLALGESLRRAGDATEAREVFTRAAVAARERGDGERLARAALGLGSIGLGGGWWGAPGMIDESLCRLLEESLDALPGRDSPLRPRLLSRLAKELYWKDAAERREALTAEAVALARVAGDPAELASALIDRAMATLGPSDLEERARLIGEARVLAEQTGDRERALDVQVFAIIDLFERGEREDLDQAIATYLRLAGELREPRHLWYGHVLQAAQALLDGRQADAEESATEAVELARRTEDPSGIQIFAAQMAEIRFQQDRLVELEAALRGFTAQYPSISAWRCVLAVAYTEAGRFSDARAVFERLATQGFDRLPRDIYWSTSVRFLARVSGFLVDRQRAPALYELLLPHEGRYVVLHPSLGSMGPVSLGLGELALVMRRWNDAVRHLESAVAQCERLGDRPWRILAIFALAGALLFRRDSGDLERARALLGEVHAASGQLGIPDPAGRPAFRRLFLETAAELGIESMVRDYLGGDIEDSEEAAHGSGPRRAPGARRWARRAATAVRLQSLAGLARLVRGADDDEIEQRFGSPTAQRALFTAMAMSFQPSKAFGFEGHIDFDLSYSSNVDRPPELWTVHVKSRRATARRGSSASPAATIGMTLADFVRTVAGELNPIGALIEGQTEVVGDLPLASRLVDMFGGRSPD